MPLLIFSNDYFNMAFVITCRVSVMSLHTRTKFTKFLAKAKNASILKVFLKYDCCHD